MTDKLQKIREEVIKLFNHVKGSNFESDSGAFYYLKDLLDFIDSLQEEPKPKFKIGDMVVSESGKYAKIESIDTDKYWCKGENGMSIPFKYQDKWKLVEEPVSEDLEEAANEWDAKASFTPFYMGLDDNGNPNGVRQDYTTHAESFKAGAKWRKEQLIAKGVETTFNVSLPSGLYDKLWIKGCKEGDKLLVIKKDEL